MKQNYATPQQVLDAFENLTDAQVLALRAVAAKHIKRTRYSEPADLIHEVLDKCLKGTRHWPMTIPFLIYMTQAVKSTGLVDQRRAETNRVVYLDTTGISDALDHELMTTQNGFMGPEDTFEAKQMSAIGKLKIQALKDAFGDDYIAKTLITGWANNVQTKDVLRINSITQKEFDAARKRITRHLSAQASRRLQ